MGIKSLLAGGLSDTLSGLIELVVKEGLQRFVFPALYKMNPQQFKVGMVSAYPSIDVYLEEAVKQTETPYDDAFVKAIKESCEDYAAEIGVELPNMDKD